MVAKKELKYAGPFGLCLTLCGTIFLDRGSSESGRRAINEAGKKVAWNFNPEFFLPYFFNPEELAKIKTTKKIFFYKEGILNIDKFTHEIWKIWSFLINFYPWISNPSFLKMIAYF